jgi:hypothetical protein
MVIGKRAANESVSFRWRNPLNVAQNTDEPPQINFGWFSRAANDELIHP